MVVSQKRAWSTLFLKTMMTISDLMGTCYFPLTSFNFIPSCVLTLTSEECGGQVKLAIISHNCTVMLSYFLWPEPLDPSITSIFQGQPATEAVFCKCHHKVPKQLFCVVTLRPRWYTQSSSRVILSLVVDRIWCLHMHLRLFDFLPFCYLYLNLKQDKAKRPKHANIQVVLRFIIRNALC